MTSKWSDPYKYPNNHTNTKNYSGVYIIRLKETKVITYIGMSKSCIYKALYHHFQKWIDPTCRIVSYCDKDIYEVRTIKVPKCLVDYVERRLIKFFKPKDNYLLYEGDDEIPEPEYDEFWSNLKLETNCIF